MSTKQLSRALCKRVNQQAYALGQQAIPRIQGWLMQQAEAFVEAKGGIADDDAGIAGVAGALAAIDGLTLDDWLAACQELVDEAEPF